MRIWEMLRILSGRHWRLPVRLRTSLCSSERDMEGEFGCIVSSRNEVGDYCILVHNRKLQQLFGSTAGPTDIKLTSTACSPESLPLATQHRSTRSFTWTLKLLRPTFPRTLEAYLPLRCSSIVWPLDSSHLSSLHFP
jgi:hypothetical protein